MLNDAERGNGNENNTNSGPIRYFQKANKPRRRVKSCCPPPTALQNLQLPHFRSLRRPWVRLRLSFCPSCCCPALISAASGAARQRALACLTLPRATERQTGRARIDSAFGRSALRRVSPGQTRAVKFATVTHGRLAVKKKKKKHRACVCASECSMWRPISLEREAREKWQLTEEDGNSR